MQTLDQIVSEVLSHHPHQPEFHQAVHEVTESLRPFLDKNPQYMEQGLLERLLEPERIITFRVPRVDDSGVVQVNRGYRVQFNSAIGPYKGGIRFHPSVNLSILKFLGFEQIFKNSLTSLPMGGGKGGADFDPRGKSDGEVMRFCQSFGIELSKHIGEDTDIPAGDIGVGAREIGFMTGIDRKLRNKRSGVFTGKGLSYGGSLIRPEATGYGVVYFLDHVLRHNKQSLKGKKVLISGSGNVAQFAIKKAIDMGAIVISASDSDGTVIDNEGFTEEKLAILMDIKNTKRGRISEYATAVGADFFADENPRNHKADIALPCATQNELDETDAQNLIDNRVKTIVEGANMPCTPEAITLFEKNHITYVPGKASNAGGVSTSGLEMSQNALRLSRTAEEVDQKLVMIMNNIHEQCVRYGTQDDGTVNYMNGANIAGFVKVADAMLAQGIV